MKLLSIALLSIVLCITSYAQYMKMNVVPTPSSVSPWEGVFEVTSSTRIFASNKDISLAKYLNAKLKEHHGFELRVITKLPSKQENLIIFADAAIEKTSGNGSYTLRISGNKIGLIAPTERGRFYALQTLVQMLEAAKVGKLLLQMGVVEDEPRFRYRGMHLDVSRHFQPVEFVKKFIDQMAQYKFNTFHWHLTDDQGWRIEIKKYPRLTTIGQYRSESHEGSYSTIFKGDGRPIEGFYTQEQIKDVVAYAKERHINVIPEIELPGHASAALAAYPELGKGCAAPDYKFEVKKTWGIFKEVFCPTDETFKFLEDVLDETIKLFPDSPYMHIGGDEVLKDYWKESAFVQELKKRENLKDEYEVQSYFIRRIEKFVNSKGKKIIGWDEILEGGTAPNATIMSWRGMRGGIAAAKAGHDVIMTPTDFVYFDYGQGDPAYEPLNIGSFVPLEKVYSFEPVPPELTAEEAKYILGGQANIWTEYIETPQQVEYMAFPRMIALSEVLWSKKEDRNFTDFQRRLNAILPRLDKQGVNYRIPEPGGLQNIVTENEKVSIELQPSPGTRVHYTTDGTTPDERSSPHYSKPIELTLKAGEFTTLKTVVMLPSGRKSAVYAATILRGFLREPTDVEQITPGVRYQLDTGTHIEPEVHDAGVTRSLSIQQFSNKVSPSSLYSVEFSGYFKAPTDGIYEFKIESNGGARLYYRTMEKLIEFYQDPNPGFVLMPLKAGYHPLRLQYLHTGGAPNFRFRWGIKGRGLTQAWGGEFVH